MIRLVVAGEADLLAIRFARSPVWETQHAAVSSLAADGYGRYHAAWHHAIEPRLAGIDLVPIQVVSTDTRWVPDFVAPPPSVAAPTFADQLEQIRATPVRVVRAELRRCAEASLAVGSARARLDEMVASPAAARDDIVNALSAGWEALVAPFWPRIEALIAADIAHRSRRLSTHGLVGMIADLHPDIRWSDGALEVKSVGFKSVDLGGRGVVLMPSAYLWNECVAIVDGSWQPTIVYPARGLGRLWSPTAPPPAALARLLGPTRALVLASVAEPVSTTVLAARLGRSASGVSGHLVALRDARLIRAARHGHEVLYSQTALGRRLLGRS